MKIWFRNILFIIIIGFCISCEKAIMDEAIADSPVENFDYLWREVDQHYSFFEYKNVKWNKVYIDHRSRINNQTNPYQLFDVMFDMLSELRDGHVNLISSFNISRYEFYLQGKNNYNERLIKENYLSPKYYITSPFTHDYIKDLNIGYIRYKSFSDEVSEYSMDLVLARFSETDGIILDLRQNGGGAVTNIFRILEHFVKSETPIYKSYIKTGPEHESFSNAQVASVSPTGQFFYNEKPVMVLVDRGSFSATSFFSLATKAIPNMHLVGDTTGGGLGAPSGGQLPNGWTYRISVTRTLTLDGENYEDGVPPDYFAELNATEAEEGKDAVIDKAISIILGE